MPAAPPIPSTRPRRTCECNHGGGPFDPQPCGEPARFRVVVVCVAADCDDPACAYDLCHDCADQWVGSAEPDDSSAPRLRVEPL